MRRITLTAAALALATASVASAGAVHAQEFSLKRLTIGTNPAGSVYYLIGGAFTKLWQEELNVRATPQPHSGSSVYIPLVNNGEITMGLNSTLDSAMAFAGEAPYTNKNENLRAMARFWVLPVSFIVRGNSDIRKMEDLKGKRVMVDIRPNIPLGQFNRALLATGGLTDKDVQSIPSGGLVTGLEAVAEGRVDASQAALGMPQLRRMHSSVPGGIRVVELGAKGTDEVMASVQAGTRTLTVNPGAALPFIEQPTQVGSFDAYVNISTHVSAEDVYLLVKSLHTNWEKLQKDYPPLRGVQVNELAPASNVIPYHEGAIRYYKEVGLWSAENEATQAKLTK